MNEARVPVHPTLIARETVLEIFNYDIFKIIIIELWVFGRHWMSGLVTKVIKWI